jgi:hypothetical protein
MPEGVYCVATDEVAPAVPEVADGRRVWVDKVALGAIQGVSRDSASNFCLSPDCRFLRIRYKAITRTMATQKSPPMTPPAIAPAGDDEAGRWVGFEEVLTGGEPSSTLTRMYGTVEAGRSRKTHV